MDYFCVFTVLSDPRNKNYIHMWKMWWRWSFTNYSVIRNMLELEDEALQSSWTLVTACVYQLTWRLESSYSPIPQLLCMCVCVCVWELKHWFFYGCDRKQINMMLRSSSVETWKKLSWVLMHLWINFFLSGSKPAWNSEVGNIVYRYNTNLCNRLLNFVV